MSLFSHSRTVEELEAELAEVDAAIASLPSKSEAFVRAQEIIEANRSSAPTEEIDAMLAREGLPSLAQCGTIAARDMAPLNRLRRRRKSLVRKLDDAKKGRTGE